MSARVTKSDAVSLRSAQPVDAALIYAVIEQTMRGYVEATWGKWVPERVREESEHDALDPRTRIVQCNGTDCGVLQVDQRGNELWVQMCFIFPVYQGLGIGRALLREVQDRAQREGLPVRLRVMKVNPAKAFYKQLGFCEYDRCDDFVYLQWQA